MAIKMLNRKLMLGLRDIMNRSNKGFIIAIAVSFSTMLAGCGESSDELDDKLTHTADLYFINSLPYMADFYVDKRNISTGYSGLFDSNNLVSADVNTNDIGSAYTYSYKAINNMINLGVKDSVNVNKEERTTTTLKNSDDLWVIAWEASGERLLSVIDKKSNNTADVFNVRVFANDSYDVSVDGVKILTTEKGKVTEYLSISHCVDGLKVAGRAIDLCAANIGGTYLLVVDNNGKRVMAEE